MMYLSNILPPALPNSSRVNNFSSNLEQAAADGPEPTSDDSQRIVNQVISAENNVDLDERANSPASFKLPFQQPPVQELETAPSQGSDVIEKQAYNAGISAYLEQAAEQVEKRDQRDQRDFSKFIKELSQGNPQLRTYRQTRAHQYQSLPTSLEHFTDSEDAPPNQSVTMYNQAITAYIQQDLYFDSINKIGLFIRV